jgi:hypothetical protein
VRFDDSGIRDVAELKVLQYRRTNFTHTFNEEVYNSSHYLPLKRKLKLIEVATVRNNSLMFLAGDKDNNIIWPGILIVLALHVP